MASVELALIKPICTCCVCHSPSVFYLGFPCGSDSKESACNVEDLDSVPGLGRSPEGRNGNPLQYSCLKKPHGQRRLVGYAPWAHKESDTTKRLTLTSPDNLHWVTRLCIWWDLSPALWCECISTMPPVCFFPGAVSIVSWIWRVMWCPIAWWDEQDAWELSDGTLLELV